VYKRFVDATRSKAKGSGDGTGCTKEKSEESNGMKLLLRGCLPVSPLVVLVSSEPAQADHEVSTTNSQSQGEKRGGQRDEIAPKVLYAIDYSAGCGIRFPGTGWR
jgi:hypothetical protein